MEESFATWPILQKNSCNREEACNATQIFWGREHTMTDWGTRLSEVVRWLGEDKDGLVVRDVSISDGTSLPHRTITFDQTTARKADTPSKSAGGTEVFSITYCYSMVETTITAPQEKKDNYRKDYIGPAPSQTLLGAFFRGRGGLFDAFSTRFRRFRKRAHTPPSADQPFILFLFKRQKIARR